MNKRLSSKISLFAGLLLVMMLVLTLVNNENPIGYSKNALFRKNKPEKVLELSGPLAWAGGNSYYNYYKGNIKKIQLNGNAIWEMTVDGELLWMGPEGIILKTGSTLYMLDEMGEPVFEKSDFLNDPRVLCVNNEYILLSGKINANEYAVLLSLSGDIMWQLLIDGSVISGNVDGKGVYSILNIIDKKAESNISLIGSKGQIIWDKTYKDIVFQTRIVASGIGFIREDKTNFTDFQGKILWEHPFEGQVIRGDIGYDGYISVVVRESAGHLSQDSRPKIIMFSSQGEEVCTYTLERDPKFVKKSDNYLYIVDDYGIMVLSQEGLMVTNIELNGVKELVLVEPGGIIAIQENKSTLLK